MDLNKDVKYIKADRGEYGKEISPGAYYSLPVFDENMNIVDRIGYIYFTRLSEYSKEKYGNRLKIYVQSEKI